MKMCTANCEKECKYGTVYQTDKAHVFVRCEANDKSYIYGQIIDCSLKEVRNE